jgi:hypothetical protein
MKYLELKNNNWVEITPNAIQTKNEETNLIKTTIERVESTPSAADKKAASSAFASFEKTLNKKNTFELISATYISENINKLHVVYNLNGELTQTFI